MSRLVPSASAAKTRSALKALVIYTTIRLYKRNVKSAETSRSAGTPTFTAGHLVTAGYADRTRYDASAMSALGGRRATARPPAELRERIGAAIFRLVTPVVRRVIRAAWPAGPNVLLTVRGRKSGLARSTPIALLELGDRRFLQASFGEVDWVRNLRASCEAVVTRRGQSQRYRAVEMAPESAGPLLRDTLLPFHRSRLLRALLGPHVRPPAAILHRYHFRIDETPQEYLDEATRHLLFELLDPQDP